MDSIPFLFTEDTLINRLTCVFNKQDFKKKKQQLPQAENCLQSVKTSTTHCNSRSNNKQYMKWRKRYTKQPTGIKNWNDQSHRSANKYTNMYIIPQF